MKGREMLEERKIEREQKNEWRMSGVRNFFLTPLGSYTNGGLTSFGFPLTLKKSKKYEYNVFFFYKNRCLWRTALLFDDYRSFCTIEFKF